MEITKVESYRSQIRLTQVVRHDAEVFVPHLFHDVRDSVIVKLVTNNTMASLIFAYLVVATKDREHADIYRCKESV